jgi:hypothetical protein
LRRRVASRFAVGTGVNQARRGKARCILVHDDTSLTWINAPAEAPGESEPVEAVMVTYRCYLLDENGRHRGIEALEAGDDSEAVMQARALFRAVALTGGFDIWSGPRHIYLETSGRTPGPAAPGASGHEPAWQSPQVETGKLLDNC